MIMPNIPSAYDYEIIIYLPARLGLSPICYLLLIEKIALRDIDLLLAGKQFKINFYIWNGESLRRNVWETFVDFDICHRKV